jgi:hypothetical protein
MSQTRSTHFVYRFTGIGRSVDPSFPTNAAILLLASLALVVAALLSVRGDSDWLDGGLLGVNAAITVFLAWALTRELSPDDELGAFLAAAQAGVAWFALGSQSLIIPVVLLVALRLVNRSTGKAMEPIDELLVPPLFAFAAWAVAWPLGLVGSAAYALDAALPAALGQVERRNHLAMSAFLLTLTTLRLVMGTPGIQVPHRPLLLFLLAVVALGAALFSPTPRSRGDVDGEVLVDARVRSALLLGVLATVAVTLDAGVPTGSLGLLWCSLAAVVVRLPFLLARRT